MKKVGSDMIEIKVEKIIGEDGESIFKANPNKISIGGMLASYVDKIHITIPDEWKGCAVRITFVPRYAVPVARLIDENGYLDITKDMTIRSRGSIVIDAQNVDYAAYSTDIEYTAYDHQRAGTASGKPSPNEYEQMINIAKSAVKSVNNVLPDQNGNVNVDAQQVQQVQPDYNQNDSTAADYIKNRPFYSGPVETVIAEESTLSFTEHNGLYIAEFQSTHVQTAGKTYKVYWDGTAYECTCVDFDGEPIIGNLSILGAGYDTGEPFVMIQVGAELAQIATADSSSSHTFSISEFVEEGVKKIDRKYLPEAAIITYDLVNNTYDSDFTYDELYEIMLDFGQVVAYDKAKKSYYYLTYWRKQSSGRIDLRFDGGNLTMSLFTDGTIGKPPVE